MAKKIHWQIPFASAIDKKQYRVDIYQEGYTGSLVTLLAGSSPFNTEEDNNPDLFTPIRTQSGTLSVVTKLPDDSMLKAQDILPANNTDCPVVLVELNDGEEEVVWQGFLSCEAYSQDYIGIAQELSLSLISVLEAMDSVECDPTRLQGVVPVFYLIGYCFDEMERNTGFSLFNRIYIGEQGKAIASRYINTSLFFDVQEQNDEGYNEAILKGISLKEVLTKVATFMGWCVREDAERIFIQTAGADNDWISGTVAEIMYDHQFATAESALYDLADLDWRGTAHRISSRQGARNVEVVANMTPFDIEVGIPDGFPQGEYLTGSLAYVSEGTGEEGADENVTLEAYASKEQGFSSRCEFKNWYQENISDAKPLAYTEQGTVSDIFADTIIGHESSLNPIGDQYLGAFMARLKNDEIDYDKTGLYVNAYWANTPDNVYVLRMRSIDHLNAYNGKFILKADGILIDANPTAAPFSHIVRGIRLAIKWGGMYLQADKKTWGSAFAYNDFEWNEDNNGEIEIPIKDYNYGEVELFLFPHSLTWWQTDMASYTVDEFMFTELSLTYQAPEDVFEDRDANHYFEALKTAFRDEVSVECDFGSSLDNLPNPSLILNVDPVLYYEPLTRMLFYDGMLTEERPEKHLLSRLATYYRKPHTSLELAAAFSGVLPMMRYRGLNDGKFYLPMAASRDWQQDTATLSMLQCEPYWRVYTEDGQIWTKDWDYILLHGIPSSKVISISSDTELTWQDRDFQMQSVYINGENGSGTIPAGNKVAVVFAFDPHVETNERGTIDFYRDGKLLFSLDVVAEY